MAINQTADIQEESEDTQKDRYLTFSLGTESYGMGIEHVIDIIRQSLHPITRLPEVPDHIKGIINLRSKIVPIIDMRLRLRKQPRDYDDRTCIIVVEVHEMTVGLVVDAVAEVVTIESGNIVPPPENSVNAQNSYVSGIGMVDSEVTLLLDCEQLLNYDDLRSMVS